MGTAAAIVGSGELGGMEVTGASERELAVKFWSLNFG